MVRGAEFTSGAEVVNHGDNTVVSASSKAVVRQPIFDRQKQVFGYELLFHDDMDSAGGSRDDDKATIGTVDSGMNLIGLQELIGPAIAFVNITRPLLLSGHCTTLPSEQVVVELLESIDPNPDVLEACETLKDLGYIIALGDVGAAKGYEPLLDYADIAKVDFLQVEPSQRGAIIQGLRERGIKVLAEKVESHSDFADAMDLGCTYFQGFFFCKPMLVLGREIPGSKIKQLRLIAQVNEPQIDMDLLESLIKLDVLLSMKLLKYLNTVSFGFSRKITSIKHALVLLGEHPIRKWATTVAVAGIASEKPPALAATSLARARFCEELGPEGGLPDRRFDLFTMGMLSVVDAMVDRPLIEVISELPLHPEVKQALLGDDQNRISKIYKLVTAYERGDWRTVRKICQYLQVPSQRVAQFYLDSITWTDENFG